MDLFLFYLAFAFSVKETDFNQIVKQIYNYNWCKGYKGKEQLNLRVDSKRNFIQGIKNSGKVMLKK